MKVGLARVSTYNRAQDISIAAQEQQLLDAGCDRVITVRESAFKGPRRGWHELRSLVAGGTVTEVLCIDQSRLARDGSDLEFLEECAVRNVTVRALTGGVIETKTVGGFVQAGVFSVMNQAYSRQLGLKVKDGLDRGKANGRFSCGRVPFGYKYNTVTGKVEPHPDDWPVARQMVLDLLAVEMNVNGYIKKHRSKWTGAGIRGWLVKPMLRGIVANQPEGVKPLFSSAEWSTAARLIEVRKRSKSSNSRTVHLLTGLVRCDCCQKNLKYKVVARGVSRIYCANPACDWYGSGIRVPLVRSQLVNALRAAAQEMQEAIEQSTETTGDEKSMEQIQAESKVAQLEALRESGVPGLETALSALRNEIAALVVPTVGPDWTGLAELLAVPGLMEGFPDAKLRPLLLEYVKQIVYVGNPTEVKIRLRREAK